MKRNIMLATVLFAAGSVMAADPKDDVTSAAKSLADAGNYSWTQTTENAGGGGGGGGFGAGTMEGKAQKDGLIYTSRTFNDNTIETVLKGTNGAVNGQDGWQTFEEMAAANAQNGGGGGGGGGGFRRGGFGGRNFVLPAAQLQNLLTNVAELKESGGAYVGDFTEDGAKKVLMPPNFGRRGGAGGGGGGGDNGGGPTVSNAKGSVRIWIKDGRLTKYEIKISGTVSFNDNDRDIDRTTTVEIKDVGATKITVPDDILKKIGG